MKHNALYVTATGPLTGKSAIALGTMQMLSRHMRNVAFFRPIINEPQLDDRDPDINLMLEHFKINMEYADTFAYTHAEAREIINQGSRQHPAGKHHPEVQKNPHGARLRALRGHGFSGQGSGV